VTLGDLRTGGFDDVATSFGLRLDELDILLEDLGLSRYLYPYEVPFVSGTFSERAQQRARTWERLRDVGLADGRGLWPDVEDLLRLWVSPQMLLTQLASVVADRGTYQYRGGWTGKHAVLSHRRGETVVFEALRPEQVVPEMLSFLPDWRALPAQPTTIVVPPRRPVQGDDTAGEVVDSADDLPTPEARAVERFFAAPMLRYGVITCSATDTGTVARSGRTRRLGSMAWFDTGEGRFFQVSEDLTDGAQRQTYTPADTRRMAQWLRERFAEVMAG
jgi:hypothetical protein